MLFNIKQYDIFISYVAEDRELVEVLYKGLKSKGIRIWYAKEQLRAGNNIAEVIHAGLKNVHYGLVLLSPHYTSYWSAAESFILMNNMDRLLPILHNKTTNEVTTEIPGFNNNIFCLNTKYGIENVIEDICKQVKRKSKVYYVFADAMSYLKKNLRLATKILIAFFLLLVSIAFAWHYNSIRPPYSLVKRTIDQRKSDLEGLAKRDFLTNLANNETTASSVNDIRDLTPSSNRKYTFSNGTKDIKSLPVLKKLGIVPAGEPISPPFGLTEYKVHIFRNEKDNPNGLKYTLVNLLPHLYEVTDARLESDLYEVDVRYTNALRYVEVSIFSDSIKGNSCVISLLGAKPNETLVFKKVGVLWTYLQVK